jgi:hypothetical protein
MCGWLVQMVGMRPSSPPPCTVQYTVVSFCVLVIENITVCNLHVTTIEKQFWKPSLNMRLCLEYNFGNHLLHAICCRFYYAIICCRFYYAIICYRQYIDMVYYRQYMGNYSMEYICNKHILLKQFASTHFLLLPSFS